MKGQITFEGKRGKNQDASGNEQAALRSALKNERSDDQAGFTEEPEDGQLSFADEPEDDQAIFEDVQDGEDVSFHVLAEERINNVKYLLVAESDDDDAEAFILKEVSESEEGDSVLVTLSDDEEIQYIGRVFQQKLDDIDLVI